MNTITDEQSADSGSDSRREFVLASMRVAALNLRSWASEIDMIGTALKANLIGVDAACDWLNELLLLEWLLCDCSRDIVTHWERDYPPVEPKRLRATRATPQVVIEAIMYCVRERGVQAMREVSNIERLSHCDAAAKAQVNARVAKLIEGSSGNG